MKNITFLFLLLSTAVSAQQASCCTAGVNARNCELAQNETFAMAHTEPLPFTLEQPKGEMITFKTGDEKDGRAYVVKAPTATANVVFMFHEWWGLNDYIKQEAEKLQAELGNVTVYAIDLYDGQLATTTPEAQKYMSTLSETRARAIVDGAIKYVGPTARISTIGWCMGGAWSLQAALAAGKQAQGCVIYYGMPEGDINKLKMIQCDVLGIFAEQDKFINPTVVKGFEENMKKAGKKLTIHNYNADHAFANPSNPKHNKEFTEDAYKKTVAYLKGKLKS